MKPLIPYLASVNYCGYVDVACIVDEKTGTPYPLEFTSRFGYPLWQIQQALHVGDPAQWMLDLINGKDTLQVKSEIAVGVVLSNGTFPKKPEEYGDEQGYPINLDKVNVNDVHPSEVKVGTNLKIEDGKIKKVKGWVTAGNYILVTTGIGNNIIEAKDKAYKVIKNIEVSNSPQYRTDIGERLEKQLPILHKFGYATEFSYDGSKVKTSSIGEEYARAFSRKVRL